MTTTCFVIMPIGDQIFYLKKKKKRIKYELKEDDLRKKYEDLFKDAIKCLGEELMVFGCECGDGWYKILDDLLEKLAQCDSLYLVQVKEKFGCLTVYFELEKPNKSVTDKAYIYTEEARNKSAITCEKCGGLGKIRKGLWIKTLCDTCYFFRP